VTWTERANDAMAQLVDNGADFPADDLPEAVRHPDPHPPPNAHNNPLRPHTRPGRSPPRGHTHTGQRPGRARGLRRGPAREESGRDSSRFRQADAVPHRTPRSHWAGDAPVEEGTGSPAPAGRVVPGPDQWRSPCVVAAH